MLLKTLEYYRYLPQARPGLIGVKSGPDPGFSVGGGVDPFWGGFGLQRGHFSVKMYAKTKKLGPVGGAMHQHAPLDLPMEMV